MFLVQRDGVQARSDLGRLMVQLGCVKHRGQAPRARDFDDERALPRLRRSRTKRRRDGGFSDATFAGDDHELAG